jgi:signal peptidase I
MNSRHVLLFRITLGAIILAALCAAAWIILAVSHDGTQKVVDGLARTRLGNVVTVVAIFTVLRLGLAPYQKSQPIHLRFIEYRMGKVAGEALDALIYAGVFVFMVIRPFVIQAFLIPSGSMWPTLGVNDFIVANKAVYRYTQPKDNDVVVFHPPDRSAHPDQLDAEGHITVDFVKRLIGSPGETIEFRDGSLYRNGQIDPLDAKHAHFSIPDQEGSAEPTSFHEMPEEQVKSLPRANFKFVKYKGQVIPLNYSQYDANSPNPAMNAYGPVVKEFEIDDPQTQHELMKAPAQPIPPGMYFFMGDNRNGSDDGRYWGLVPRDSIIGRSEFVWLPLSHMHMTR